MSSLFRFSSRVMPVLLLALAPVVCPAPARAQDTVPENVYQGELVSFPGPYAFLLHRPHIILINDDQLRALADPDAQVDLSLTYDKRVQSLRQIC